MDEKISLWKRIYGVLWGSPAKTLEGIAQEPRFWGLAGLITLLNLLLTIPTLPKTREVVILGMQSAPGQMKLTAAQIDTIANVAVYTTCILAVIGPVLIWIIIAALLKLFNAFTGEKASFNSLIGIAVFSYIPVFLNGIIQTPLKLAADAQNMSSITISPAIFLPPTEGLYPDRLHVFLSQLDPFLMWAIVLMALGASIAMKVPFRRAAAYLGSLWLVLILAITLLAHAPGA